MSLEVDSIKGVRVVYKSCVFIFLIIDLKVTKSIRFSVTKSNNIMCENQVFYYFLHIAPKVSLNLKTLLFYSVCSSEQCV